MTSVPQAQAAAILLTPLPAMTVSPAPKMMLARAVYATVLLIMLSVMIMKYVPTISALPDLVVIILQ
jgi:hypothetical protein